MWIWPHYFYLFIFTAQEDPQQACDDIECNTEYDPQCGSNGRTFDNSCEFSRALCSDTSLKIAYAGECKFGKYCFD